eukprot:5701698-Pleurochrysis_carterae.AAC.1
MGKQRCISPTVGTDTCQTFVSSYATSELRDHLHLMVCRRVRVQCVRERGGGRQAGREGRGEACEKERATGRKLQEEGENKENEQ